MYRFRDIPAANREFKGVLMDYLKFEADKESRADLAKLLNGVGRGVNARLDVPMVCLNDLKWFVYVLDQSLPELKRLAYQDDRPDVYRVVAVRSLMDNMKGQLHRKNQRLETIKLQKKNRANPY